MPPFAETIPQSRAQGERLAFFLPALQGGGAERSILKLANGIAAQGTNVDLVLARKEGPYLPEVMPSVRVVDLGASRDLFALPAMVRYLRKERPRAVLSGLHTNLIALWARRLARIPSRIVVSERNALFPKLRHYSSDMRMRLMPKLIRRFYPWADEIVAVSQGVADELASAGRIPRHRIRVIHNPIVTPELERAARMPLEHPWFKPGEPPVILAAGRLTAQKDFPGLVKAFSRVREARPARLLILGEGEERPALEKLISLLGLQESIGLPGFIVNPYPYMAGAFLFVLSSRWEGLPGVLIEAMYCGTRLVATDCPSGPREILRDGRYGRLVPVGDIEALAQAIGSALTGELSPPPPESWESFRLERVVAEYRSLMLGNNPERR